MARRRDFPPGTPTTEVRVTLSINEADRLRERVERLDTNPSQYIADVALAKTTALTTRDKAELLVAFTNARAQLAAIKMMVDKASMVNGLTEAQTSEMIELLRETSLRVREATEGIA